MATIDVRKNRDGSKSFLAQVRLKGFKPVAKAFSTKKDAKAWADALEGELRGHRDTKAVRADVATLTGVPRI